MNEMKEIIDEKTVELILRIIGIGGPIAGLVIGACHGVITRRFLRSLLHGFGLGCTGLLVWVMWIYYSWTVRYDPKTGYVGLHKVSVLLINLAVFSLVGVLVGGVWGLIARRKPTT